MIPQFCTPLSLPDQVSLNVPPIWQFLHSSRLAPVVEVIGSAGGTPTADRGPGGSIVVVMGVCGAQPPWSCPDVRRFSVVVTRLPEDGTLGTSGAVGAACWVTGLVKPLGVEWGGPEASDSFEPFRWRKTIDRMASPQLITTRTDRTAMVAANALTVTPSLVLPDLQFSELIVELS